MHYPQQLLVNQPQLFNLHKIGDSDPWEQDKYIPDINEQKSYQLFQNSQPLLNQIIQPPQQQQISNQSIKQVQQIPTQQVKQIQQLPNQQVKQVQQLQQENVTISQDPNSFSETNPLAYFEYLQKKYMDAAPEKENKENIPKTQPQIAVKDIKSSPNNQPKPLQQPHQALAKKQANFDTVYTQFAEKIYNQSKIETNQGEAEKEIVNDILLGKQDILKIQKKNAAIKRMAESKVSGQQRNNKSQISNIDQMTSEEKQLEQCTFAPKINSKNKQTIKRRTIDEFLENQKQFQLQVEEKKNKLKDQIDQEKAEQLQKPLINKKQKINKKTDISIDEKQNQSVYERLYSKANESQANSTFQQDSQYMPQIGEKSRKIHRSEKIENLLYQDALRRQEVQKLNEDIKRHQEKLPFKKVVSQNSKKILIQKFLKDFEHVMQSYFPKSCNQEFECKIDYLQLGEILKSLGFLLLNSCSEKPSFSNERTMLYEIWQLLRGDNYGGILKRNLCILLLAIQGLYCHFPMERENIESNESLGFFNEQTQEWEVTQDDARQLQQKFDLLYRNKLQNEEIKKIQTEEEYEFKPMISETSKVLAQHYRERLLEETASLLENNELDIKLPANGKISHTDLLVIQKQAQLAEHQKRFQQQTEEEFSQYSIMSKPSQNSSTGQHRALELYKLAKPQSMRCDRTPSDIEYEKSMDVCTFQPCINKKNGGKKQKQVSAKNVDKTIERMRLARKERELLNQWKSRGVPSQNIILELNQLNEQFGCYQVIGQNQNESLTTEINERLDQNDIQKEDIEQPFSNYQLTEQTNNDIQQFEEQNGAQLQQQQEEEEEQEEEGEEGEEEEQQNQQDENEEENVPLLFVDVNLGPQMADRIVVYEGDSAEQLAEEFAIKHSFQYIFYKFLKDLDENLQDKLVELLNEQIRGLLTKIEEEEGSENEDEL